MTSGSFTPEATAAIDLCVAWSSELVKDVAGTVYLFGSAIYDGGEQFDAQQSDLDLIFLFDDPLDAEGRAHLLADLRQHKLTLEVHIIPTLHRTNCAEPGVSVVPITSLELQANIHKSGARRFFDKNTFLDLLTDKETLGIPGAGTHSIADEARQALEYTQKVRNQFLGISANLTGTPPPYDGIDPLPKALTRAAAQLVPDQKAGSWYDTRFGLEYICGELAKYRGTGGPMEALYDKVSVRRGGRGRREALNDLDQLLLAELLYDLASASPLTKIATWEIRFGGIKPTPEAKDQLVEKLRDLVPTAEIIGVFDGSVIVRLRSSERSLSVVLYLAEQEILSSYFDVETVEIAEISGERVTDAFPASGWIDQLAEQIRLWRPQTADSERDIETSLADWLGSRPVSSTMAGRALISRDTLVTGGFRPLQVDLLVRLANESGDQQIAVEIVRLRDRSRFFQVIDRMDHMPIPAILVLVATSELLETLRADIDRFSSLEGALRVVSVPLNDG